MKIINPLTLSEKERSKIVNTIKERFINSRDYYQDKFDTWVRCYKIYKAIADAVDKEEEINIFIPYAFGIIEDIVARTVDPLLDKLPIKAVAKNKLEQKNADNFMSLFQSYFQSSEQIEELIKNEKEKIIIGNAWEKDEWACEWVKAYKWEKTKATKIMESIVNFAGKLVPIKNEVSYNKLVEQEYLYPKKVGYYTTYLSAFTIFPEPRVKNYRNLKWLIQFEEDVSVEDLKNMKYIDENGEQQIYYLDELLKDFRNDIDSIRPSIDSPLLQYNEVRTLTNKLYSSTIDTTESKAKGKVHLKHMYEPNAIYTIANDKYLIKIVKDPFHIPHIPFRLKTYTPEPESLYGVGAIEPVEHLFYELNDIHRLSMRSWIRIVNGLVAYHKDAVPFPDDWKLEAGGKVRIDPGISPNIHQAISSIPLQDPTKNMVYQESNTKGFIERIISVSDLSPGVSGSKPYHKTATGLIEIQQSLARRFSIMRKLQLSNLVERLYTAYNLMEQFLFEPIKTRIRTKYGDTIYPDLTREDILCNDGIDFLIVNDPSFGNTTVQRNQLMVLLEVFLKYESFRLKSGDSSLLKVKITDLIKKIIESFGWQYGEEMMEQSNNTLSPEIEFEMIMNGQYTPPNPLENITEHLAEHYIQLNSQTLSNNVERGRVPPEYIELLKKHISDTTNLLMQIIQNPDLIIQEKLKSKVTSKAYDKKDLQYEKENIIPLPKGQTKEVVNANV